jgi:uncharacterized protein YlxW (UPF0749 family)
MIFVLFLTACTPPPPPVTKDQLANANKETLDTEKKADDLKKQRKDLEKQLKEKQEKLSGLEQIQTENR